MIDQEAACDASVMALQTNAQSCAHTYAQALVKAAKLDNPPTPLALSFGPNFKERLMYIAQPQKTKTRKTFGKLTATALILGGLAASASYGYAETKGKAVFELVYFAGNQKIDDYLNISTIGSMDEQARNERFELLKSECGNIPNIKDATKLNYQFRMYQLTMDRENPDQFGASTHPFLSCSLGPKITKDSPLDAIRIHNRGEIDLITSLIVAIEDSNPVQKNLAGDAVKALQKRIHKFEKQVEGDFQLEGPDNRWRVKRISMEDPRLNMQAGTIYTFNIPFGKNTILDFSSEKPLKSEAVNISDCGEIASEISYFVLQDKSKKPLHIYQDICMPSDSFASAQGQIEFMQSLSEHYMMTMPRPSAEELVIMQADLQKAILKLSN